MVSLDEIDYSHLIDLNPRTAKRYLGSELWTRWSGGCPSKQRSRPLHDLYTPPHWTEFELPTPPDPLVPHLKPRMKIGVLSHCQNVNWHRDVSGDSSFVTGNPVRFTGRRCLSIDFGPRNTDYTGLDKGHPLVWLTLLLMLFIIGWIAPNLTMWGKPDVPVIELGNIGIHGGILLAIIIASLPD
jgi:hypothetical protein